MDLDRDATVLRSPSATPDQHPIPTGIDAVCIVRVGKTEARATLGSLLPPPGYGRSRRSPRCSVGKHEAACAPAVRGGDGDGVGPVDGIRGTARPIRSGSQSRVPFNWSLLPFSVWV